MFRTHVGLIVSTLLLAGAASAAEQAPDTMEARVLACAACHGAMGEGTDNAYFPRLAGKPAGYLYNQLLAFRSGRRHYPPMNYLIEYLPEDYLRKMAEYFAAQRPPLPAPAVVDVSKDLLERGHTIVTQGDPQKGIPACSGCHGKHLTGMEPAIPGLLGLRATYISAQLGGWRYGTRTAAAPDCMQIVASHLTEDDVKGVAAYLSSLPAPDDPSPAPQDSYKLLLTCGSEPQ
jgi:cytochrome c553